ncbi:MAG: transcription termination factor Tfs [Candidatus Aramenus sulfurataquae]|uniref:DNA-directed RNA polymerase subunit M n=2 Tax=Candidatus Aramenus sulfurataquae TaxID=1326980 RepID=W7KWW3_9CREN|nr:MAG: transcription termination factor Tfs [Candidatus Aramenus sulfurataquae]MBW9141024.1 transcription factor S [Candidatus Aramenus sp.]MCL7344230.1 transcription factor S [Candidatus Aramenus sulfurataquae]
MKFCPKCNSMMVPRKSNGRSVYKCVKCGYEEEAKETAKITTKIKHSEKEKTLVLEDVPMPAGTQIIRGVSCPSCKNDEAYFWILQTRSADEPATRFYKCTKCGKVWREYE